MTATATPVLEARNLYAGYGEKSILSDLTLSVGKGEFVTLLGPNGAGNTTTLLTLSGHRGRGSAPMSTLWCHWRAKSVRTFGRSSRLPRRICFHAISRSRWLRRTDRRVRQTDRRLELKGASARLSGRRPDRRN
jgi:ATPase subunit of ABC transporter with duplicated ATPase domains